MPGPGMLYICASAARGQRRRAMAFVAGTAIGTAAWAGIAVLGAWRVAADAPLLLAGLELLVGLTLVGSGGKAVLGVVAIAFAFEATRVCLVSTSGGTRLIGRLRRPLGVAFCATGAALRRLV